MVTQPLNSIVSSTSIYNGNSSNKSTKLLQSRFLLYTIFAVISLIMLINSLLIAWIINVIHFTPNGIGKMHSRPNGLSLQSTGKSRSMVTVAGSLNSGYISSPLAHRDGEEHWLNISSASGVDLTNNDTSIHVSGSVRSNHRSTVSAAARVESTVTVDTSDTSVSSRQLTYTGGDLNDAESQLFNGITMKTSRFVMSHPNSTFNFFIDSNNQLISTNTLCLNKRHAIELNCSLQAPYIWSNDEESILRIESISRQVNVIGPSSIQIDSGNTSNLLAFAKLQLKSKVGPASGSIVLNSTAIKLSSVPSIFPSTNGTQYSHIMQLCMCRESGKLYLTKPHLLCTFDASICSL